MKNIIKANMIVAAAAAFAFSGQAARADYSFHMFRSKTSTPEIAATTTTTTTFTNGATLGAGPSILVTNILGEQSMVSSILNANPVMFVTTGAQITGFNVFLPNDLLTRRDDLIARIYAEKANGKLSDSQVSRLLSEVQTVALMPCNSGKECSVSHAKQVEKMYRNFDKVSNDIFSDSHQGNRQLAGKYSFIVL
jgi:hypothetical protein